jgi:hypothetical protein
MTRIRQFIDNDQDSLKAALPSPKLFVKILLKFRFKFPQILAIIAS